MKGMQMRPFVCVIKGMYEFAFSVYIMKANVKELGVRNMQACLCRG